MSDPSETTDVQSQAGYANLLTAIETDSTIKSFRQKYGIVSTKITETKRAGLAIVFKGPRLDDHEQLTEPTISFLLDNTVTLTKQVEFIRHTLVLLFEHPVDMRELAPNAEVYSEEAEYYPDAEIITFIASRYEGTADLEYHQLSPDESCLTDVAESNMTTIVRSGMLNQWLEDIKWFTEDLLKGGKILAYWWREKNDLYYIQELEKHESATPLSSPLSFPTIVVKQMLNDCLTDAALADQIHIINFREDPRVGKELSADDNTEGFRNAIYITTNRHGVPPADNTYQIANLCETLRSVCDASGNIVVLVETCEDDSDNGPQPSESWQNASEQDVEKLWRVRLFQRLPPIASENEHTASEDYLDSEEQEPNDSLLEGMLRTEIQDCFGHAMAEATMFSRSPIQEPAPRYEIQMIWSKVHATYETFSVEALHDALSSLFPVGEQPNIVMYVKRDENQTIEGEISLIVQITVLSKEQPHE